MTSDDVVASLKRWMDMAPRGKAVAKEIKSLEAKGPNTVVITLNRPYAPLARAPRAAATASRRSWPKESIATPLTQFVGTGPVHVQGTQARSVRATGALRRLQRRAANLRAATQASARRWLDELRFIPVPNANTRVEGSLSGQYQFADLLPVESYSRIESAPNVKPVLTAPFGFPYLVLNTKQGPLANLALRQAVEAALNNADMMGAGFGDPKFYTTEASHYARNTPFYSTAGTENYGKGDAKKAAAIVAAAKYDGTPIKILTSQQYDFHYRMALVMAENLKAAGFKVDMQRGRLVDADPAPQRSRAVGHLHHALRGPARPDADAAATRRRRTRLVELAGQEARRSRRSTPKPTRRSAARCGAMCRSVVFTEVPYIRVGYFNSVTARSRQARGLRGDAVAVLLEHLAAEVRALRIDIDRVTLADVTA